MTATIMPVAVWDVREKSWLSWSRPERSAWLRDHRLPADDMYRAEFYLIDAPFARVFCYHRNEQGNRHWNDAHDPYRVHDHGACEPATVPPCDVLLDELPPPELLGGPHPPAEGG